MMIFSGNFNDKSYEMTLGTLRATLCNIQPGRESALSGLTELWVDMRLVLAAHSAGRWVVWCDDTEDTTCLLESLPHLHLVGQTQTASDSRAQIHDTV